MLTTVEGVFRNGRVELRETPANIEEARVIVTFLEPSSATPSKDRLRAFQELLASLPEAPVVPLESAPFLR